MRIDNKTRKKAHETSEPVKGKQRIGQICEHYAGITSPGSFSSFFVPQIVLLRVVRVKVKNTDWTWECLEEHIAVISSEEVGKEREQE